MTMRRSLLLALLACFPGVAFAAKLATVDQETPLRKGPSEKSVSVRKLRKGIRLTISNYPTEGFYKVRTVRNEIGWVKADTLVIDTASGADFQNSRNSE